MTWIYGEEKSFTTVTKPWLVDWQYRKSHEIIGSPAGDATDYQVRIKVVYSSDAEKLVPHSSIVSTLPIPDGTTIISAQAAVYWDGQYLHVWFGASSDGTPLGDDIYYTRTSDFINWTAPIKVIDRPSEGIRDPTIFVEGDYIYLFCQCFDGSNFRPIRLYKLAKTADFTDPANYIHVGIVVDVGPSGSYDNKWVASPAVVKIGGNYYLMYEAQSSAGVYSIGRANTSSLETLPWTKDGQLKDPNGNVIYNPTTNTRAIVPCTFADEDTLFIHYYDGAHWHVRHINGDFANNSVTLSDSDIDPPDGYSDHNAIAHIGFIGDRYYFLMQSWSTTPHLRLYKLSDDVCCLGGKSKTDFGDIRFTDSDGVTELSYWMEEKIDGDYAVFWVKVPSIPYHPIVETGEWVVDGYTYHRRTKITITENSGQNLTDYQVKVVINTKWLVDNGYATPNGNEVRFTDSEGNLLNFWRETDFNLEETVYWVKVPSIPANSIKTIYIYYDEELTGVPDASDGEAVFEFFDDFQGTSLNPDKWDEDAVNDITQTVNDYFRFEDATKGDGTYWIYNGTDTGSQHQAKVTLPTDFRVLFTSKINDTSANQMGEGGVAIIATDNTIIVYPNHGDWVRDSLEIRRYVVGENTPTNLGAGWSGDADKCWKDVSNLDKARWEIIKSGSKVTVNDENGKVCDISISSTVSKIALTAGAYGGYPYLDYVQVDYVAVAKYVDPEPSVEVEMEGQATIYIYYGNPSATTTSNGDATFIFFDDFEGTALDLNKWDVSEIGSLSYEVANGYLRIYGTRAATESNLISSIPTYSGSCALHRKAMVYSESGTVYHRLIGRLVDETVDSDFHKDSVYLWKLATPVGVSSISRGSNIQMNTWYYLELRIRDGRQLFITPNGTVERTDPLTMVERKIVIGCSGYIGSYDDHRFDYVFLRKWIDPEPSHGVWGVEESI